MLTFSVRLRRHRVLKSGTVQSKPTSFSKLCTNHVVCRNGLANNTFLVRQVWIAASLKLSCRPRLPVGGGRYVISGSNQIESDPRRFSASLQVDQFVVLYLVEAQLLIPTSYHTGFMQ
jgi:hypothetical protein